MGISTAAFLIRLASSTRLPSSGKMSDPCRHQRLTIAYLAPWSTYSVPSSCREHAAACQTEGSNARQSSCMTWPAPRSCLRSCRRQSRLLGSQHSFRRCAHGSSRAAHDARMLNLHRQSSSRLWQAAIPSAAVLSPQRTNTVDNALWESDEPGSVEQVRLHAMHVRSGAIVLFCVCGACQAVSEHMPCIDRKSPGPDRG